MFARNGRVRLYRSESGAKLLLFFYMANEKNENFLICPTGVQQMSNWNDYSSFLRYSSQSKPFFLRASMKFV